MIDYEKIFAFLLSLTMLGTSGLAVSAADESNQTYTVMNVKDGIYILDNGSILTQEQIDQYAETPFIPNVGDVVYVACGFVGGGFYNFGMGNFEFDLSEQYGEDTTVKYLGTAEDYYQNTKELTVTENTMNGVMFLQDAQGETYKMVYSYSTMGTDDTWKGYNVNFYHKLAAGTTGLFVYDENEKDVIIPVEITSLDVPLTVEPVQHVDKSEAEVTLLAGDVNFDSRVDIVDAIIINKAVLGKETLTAMQNKAADINRDGKVDSSDALEILKQVVGLTE